MRLQVALAASSLILSAGLSLAAPARAIYFSERETIFKANPDGTGKTVLFQNAVDDGFLSGLKVDSKNGHLYWLDGSGNIYRGNLDGTGAAILHATDRATDFVFTPSAQTLYYALDRDGIYAYDFVSGETTPIWQVSDTRELITPSIFYNASTSTLYWTNSYGGFWKWSAGNAPEDLNRLPIVLETGEEPDSTDIDFRGEFPAPYSWATEGILAVGGMDGNAPQTHSFASGFAQWLKLAVDPEGGFIYIAGWGPIEDGGPRFQGIFRSNLDGSELTLINALEPDGQLAIDTADLTDTDDPTVTILSPFGGTTNNQNVTIIGSVSDASPIISTKWFHDGEEQGPVDVFNGDFTVTPVALHPGANTLRIESTDIAGNTGSAEVTVTWQPLRTLEIVNIPAVQEGKRVTVQTVLDHPGDVAGMTFTLGYDPAFLGSPQVSTGGVLAIASPSFNTQTPGEVSVTFASPGVALPAGEHVLITTIFRARSVPDQTTSELTLTVADVSDSNGTPVTIGTYAGRSSIVINPRQITGDINANNRLDIGDSSLMQSMLTGSQETRDWDHLINDLNGSTTLDSGDAIRVLRAVVGLDPQPPAPGARSAARSVFAKSTGNPATGPRARLVTVQNYGATGGEIVVSIELEDMTTAFSGAAFTVDYPVAALRLTNGDSHTHGALVAGDSFLLWNVAPSQNDYANQTGELSFGASSAAPWPGSAGGGTLAELRFAIQPGATAQAAWPITIRDVEVTTAGGFDVEPVTGDTLAFIGTPISYADYLAGHLTPSQIADPGISGWDADADDDGDPNGTEYAGGSLLNDPSSRVQLEPFIQTSGGGEQYIALDFTRDLRAVDAEPFAQTSTDLTSWLTQEGGEPTSDLAEVQQSIANATETLTFVARQTLSTAPIQLIRLALPAPAPE